MPPKAAKKKDAKKKELTADDMRRLGMQEEDIQRILAEKQKSVEEKMVERGPGDTSASAGEEQRRRQQVEAKRLVKQLQEELYKLENEAEVKLRVALQDAEEAEWKPLLDTLTAEKRVRLREFMILESARRVEETKRRQEQEREAYTKSLQARSAEEREAFIAAEKKREEERYAQQLLAEKEGREREEAMLLRRKRRLAQQRAKKNADAEGDDDEDEVDAALKKKLESGFMKQVDDLQEKLLHSLGQM